MVVAKDCRNRKKITAFLYVLRTNNHSMQQSAVHTKGYVTISFNERRYVAIEWINSIIFFTVRYSVNGKVSYKLGNRHKRVET